MAVLTIRNVPDEVHRALRRRAAEHGRSAEAEVRSILATTLVPEDRPRLGARLVAIWGDAGLTDEEVALIESVRDRAPAEPLDLS